VIDDSPAPTQEHTSMEMCGAHVRKTSPIWLALLAGLACGSGQADVSRPSPFAGNTESIRLETSAVPLDKEDPSRRGIGAFLYAGGIELKGAGATRLHELSDLQILSGGRLVAVSDEGDVFTARLVLDAAGRLFGLSETRLGRLVDQRGSVLADRFSADAEGLALLPGGDWLVSFERDHRIWLYPADGGVPRAVRKPDAIFPDNAGMEALTGAPAAGRDAYLVGGEDGRVWLCDLLAGCKATAFAAMVPAGFNLTSLATFGDDGGFAMLSRAYDPRRGNRTSVRLISGTDLGPAHVRDELTLSAPLTTDNFEGIAVVPQPADGIRLYLLSDDNGSPTQHTYLLAFDWKPAP
jgi:hypothetical protein